MVVVDFHGLQQHYSMPLAGPDEDHWSGLRLRGSLKMFSSTPIQGSSRMTPIAGKIRKCPYCKEIMREESVVDKIGSISLSAPKPRKERKQGMKSM